MTKLQAASLRIVRSGKEVIRDVSFDVEAGEIYALLGGNGAGKSTTLLSFIGLLKPSSGGVYVNGTEVNADLASIRSDIAFLPESASLYEHLNAYENLQYFLQLAGMEANKDKIERALDQVSLKVEVRASELRRYSKGMRQKVAIALAILRDTDVLLLDEPTSGLDTAAIDEFHRLIRGLADDGKTVLMVTHDVYGACQIADRIGLLRGGVLTGEFSAPDSGGIDTSVVHRAFTVQAPA
ncbi:MAG: ABC transporter ATP-binding protein [Gammaproteobacteria bacterium]|nr:ABC transporter ATP-binding protein [Gammaproteobacteria bacterium]